MRAVSPIQFSRSEHCDAFDTSDHTVVFVRLQHRLPASVLTLSFQQSFPLPLQKHILPLQQVTPSTLFPRVPLPGSQLSQSPLCVSQSPLTPNRLIEALLIQRVLGHFPRLVVQRLGISTLVAALPLACSRFSLNKVVIVVAGKLVR